MCEQHWEQDAIECRGVNDVIEHILREKQVINGKRFGCDQKEETLKGEGEDTEDLF